MTSRPTFAPADLIGLRRVGALTVHPSGAWAAVTVERLDADGSRYVSDLWRVEVAGDGPPRRLTRGEWKDRAPAFDADGTLYFLSDRPGATVAAGASGSSATGDDDKRAQVWALPAGGGEPVPVTDEPHGVGDFRVAAGRLVAMTTWLSGVAAGEQRETRARQKKHGPSLLTFASMPARYWDHWVGPTEPRLVSWRLPAEVGAALERRDLTDGVRGLADALREPSWDLSRDGTTIALCWASVNPIDRIDDRCVALIDAASGARRELGVAPGLVHSGPRFSPDGRRVAVTRYQRTRDGYAQRSLWVYEVDDARGPIARELTGDWDRWPNAWAWSGDGARVLVTAEEQGTLPLWSVDVATGAHTRVGPARGAWDQVALTPDGSTVVGVRSALLTPPEPFALSLAASDVAPRAVPRPLGALSGFACGAGGSGAAAGMPTVRELRTDVDGRVMHTYVVEPAPSDDGSPAPIDKNLLWIHGGPVHAWSDQWHWRWSALLMAAHGFRVLLPNPAGSTGYGIAWVDGIWGNVWGARCYDDLMGLVAALERDGVRAADTVVMGGSFGGYMTNWIGSRTDKFRLLVTHASLFRMSSFFLATDVPAWWELMMGGTLWSDADFDRYSPSNGMPDWKTPTLVLHGEKDYRVPITEALALFEALQRHGVPSELAVFPDENHWIMRPKNIVAWYETVLGFVARRWSRDEAAGQGDAG